jgi:hypothetical protein
MLSKSPRNDPLRYGTVEKLSLLVSGYLGLRRVLSVNVAIYGGWWILMGINTKYYFREIGFTEILCYGTLMTVCISALSYRSILHISRGLGRHQMGAIVMALLFGLNSSCGAGLILFAIISHIAANEMYNYGLSASLFMRRNTMQRAIEKRKISDKDWALDALNRE